MEENQKAALRVFLSAQIRRREFGRTIAPADLKVIGRSARSALAVPIAANPAFREALDKHLALLEADIAAGKVEELVLSAPE